MLYNNTIKYVLYISDKTDVQFLKYYWGPLDSAYTPIFVDGNSNEAWLFNSVKEAEECQKYLKEEWDVITSIEKVMIIQQSVNLEISNLNTRRMTNEELSKLLQDYKNESNIFKEEKKKIQSVLADIANKTRYLSVILNTRERSKYAGEFFTNSPILKLYGESYRNLTPQQKRDYNSNYYAKNYERLHEYKHKKYLENKEKKNDRPSKD